MTLLNYTDPIPLPAPTASATSVYYTDPMGDTWVAVSTVNSGAWARARTALYCRCYRAAAWTTPAGGVKISMDTVADDLYGMFSVGVGGITVPLTGIWMAGSRVEISPSATGQGNAHYIVYGPSNIRSGSHPNPNATNPWGSVATGVFRMAANQTITVSAEYMTASLTGVAGDGRTYLWAQYMGA